MLVSIIFLLKKRASKMCLRKFFMIFSQTARNVIRNVTSAVCHEANIIRNQPIVLKITVLITAAPVAIILSLTILPRNASAQDVRIGLPECEQIVGVDRFIEIGNPVLYTVKYLEENKYACSKYHGNASEILSCRLRSNQLAEVILTVENGTVTDIQTMDDGRECTYFNIKEEPKHKPDKDDD